MSSYGRVRARAVLSNANYLSQLWKMLFSELSLWAAAAALAHRVHVVLPGSTASMSINFVTALHTVSPWKLENEPIQTLKRNSTSLSRKCSQQSSPRLNRRARENRRRGKNVGKKKQTFHLVSQERSFSPSFHCYRLQFFYVYSLLHLSSTFLSNNSISPPPSAASRRDRQNEKCFFKCLIN